jgi:hypothetical protein
LARYDSIRKVTTKRREYGVVSVSAAKTAKKRKVGTIRKSRPQAFEMWYNISTQKRAEMKADENQIVVYQPNEK